MQKQKMTEGEMYTAVRCAETDEYGPPELKMQASAEGTHLGVQRPDDINVLLERLNSLYRATRERAVLELQASAPERLLAAVQAGARLYRQRKRQSTVIELVAVLSWLPLCIWLLIATNLNLNFVILSFVLMVVGVLCLHVLYVPARLSRSLAVLLEKSEDLKLLGPAISMYVRPDDLSEMHQSLGKTLYRLLPRLRADQAGLLTPDQKRDLLLLVASSLSPASVRISGLKALEQIGDERAYEAVCSINLFGADIQLQSAVAHCLEYLRDNASQRREMQTLLRASNAADTSSPDVLLRPAANYAETPAEQLLRPQT